MQFCSLPSAFNFKQCRICQCIHSQHLTLQIRFRCRIRSQFWCWCRTRLVLSSLPPSSLSTKLASLCCLRIKIIPWLVTVTFNQLFKKAKNSWQNTVRSEMRLFAVQVLQSRTCIDGVMLSKKDALTQQCQKYAASTILTRKQLRLFQEHFSKAEQFPKRATDFYFSRESVRRESPNYIHQ